MLLSNLDCEDCNEHFEFTDELNKNYTNFSKEECNNYEISFIKKNIVNDFEYIIILTCKRCKNKINKSFKEKEVNFHFKCENCPLKGMNFNYFLSQEDDVNQKNSINIINQNLNNGKDDASHSKVSDVLRPLNSFTDSSSPISESNYSINSNSQQYFDLEYNPYKNDNNNDNNGNNKINDNDNNGNNKINDNDNNDNNKINDNNNNDNNDNNKINDNNNNDNNNNIINPSVNNPKNSAQQKAMKVYHTPNKKAEKVKEKEKGKKIKVYFVKNNKKYALEFISSDNINNNINYIKQNLDLGNNPVFLNNSNVIDKSKSFTENRIYDGFYIEVEDE